MKYSNISLCQARLDIPYGTHHTYAILFADLLQYFLLQTSCSDSLIFMFRLWSVCLSVCLSAGLLKSYERISVKFFGGVECAPRTK